MSRWSAHARADLLAAAEFIARDDPAAAERWVASVMRRLRLMEGTPNAGRVVPEFGAASLRESVLGRFRLIYRHDAGELYVLRVWEGHRLLRLGDLPTADA